MRLSGNRLDAKHHGVRRRVASQLIAEQLVLTSRGVTSKRLRTSGFEYVPSMCNVTESANKVESTSKHVCISRTLTPCPVPKRMLKEHAFGDAFLHMSLTRVFASKNQNIF